MTGRVWAYLLVGVVVVFMFALLSTSDFWLDKNSPWYQVQKAEAELEQVRTFSDPETIARYERNLELWRLRRQDMVLRQAVKGAVWYLLLVVAPIEGGRAIVRARERARASRDAGGPASVETQ